MSMSVTGVFFLLLFHSASPPLVSSRPNSYLPSYLYLEN